MENGNENRILQIVLGKDYMNKFKVVHKLSDIPMEMVRHLWGFGEAERYFNHYMKHGKFFLVKTDDENFLIHQNNDGLITISNDKDQNVRPQRFEHKLGISYLGLSMEEFLDYLLKKDSMKKNVVKLTEDDLVRIVKRVIKESEI